MSNLPHMSSGPQVIWAGFGVDNDKELLSARLKASEERVTELEDTVRHLQIRVETAEDRANESDLKALHAEAQAAVTQSLVKELRRNLQAVEVQADEATQNVQREVQLRVAAERRAVVIQGNVMSLESHVKQLTKDLMVAETKCKDRIRIAEAMAEQRSRKADERVEKAEKRALSSEKTASSVIEQYKKAQAQSPRPSGALSPRRRSPEATHRMIRSGAPAAFQLEASSTVPQAPLSFLPNGSMTPRASLGNTTPRASLGNTTPRMPFGGCTPARSTGASTPGRSTPRMRACSPRGSPTAYPVNMQVTSSPSKGIAFGTSAVGGSPMKSAASPFLVASPVKSPFSGIPTAFRTDVSIAGSTAVPSGSDESTEVGEPMYSDDIRRFPPAQSPTQSGSTGVTQTS